MAVAVPPSAQTPSINTAYVCVPGLPAEAPERVVLVPPLLSVHVDAVVSVNVTQHVFVDFEQQVMSVNPIRRGISNTATRVDIPVLH